MTNAPAQRPAGVTAASSGNGGRGADERSALLFPALGMFAIIAGWLAFQGFRGDVEVTGELAEQRPRYHIENADWRRYDEDGAAVFDIGASGIDYFDDASMLLTDIELDTHVDGDGWRLTASRGQVPPGEKRLRLEPMVDVRGNAREGRTAQMRTPTLWVNWETRTLNTEDPVDARTVGSALQAIGMRADWSGRHVEFLSEVEVRHDAGG